MSVIDHENYLAIQDIASFSTKLILSLPIFETHQLCPSSCMALPLLISHFAGTTPTTDILKQWSSPVMNSLAGHMYYVWPTRLSYEMLLCLSPQLVCILS